MDYKTYGMKTSLYSLITAIGLTICTPIVGLDLSSANAGETKFERLPLKKVKRTVTDLEIRTVIRDHTEDKIIKIYRIPTDTHHNCSRVKLVNKKGRIYNVLVGCGK